MRDGFRDAIAGWTLIDDVDALGEYIEAAARWTKANGGEKAMHGDEKATLQLMIQCQATTAIRRGDFEPYFPADLPDDTIRDILDPEKVKP